MVSLILPVSSKTKKYTDNILSNINNLYADNKNVEIIVEENDNVTMGVNYNNAVSKAKGDKIILLHNDMVISPGFVELMDKHIVSNRIVSYTRLEPPIYPDTFPGKMILDCGETLENFDEEKFNQFSLEESLTEGGFQLFFGCMKKDYLGVDGYTFKLFCEDDDLHLRYKIAGFDHKVSSAHVYHFVSKTSREGNYQPIEQQSNIDFIKKWGFRKSHYNVVYKKRLIINNPTPQLENVLNIWFNEGNDIIVEIDGNTFTQNDYNNIQQLNDIIKDNNEVGNFKLGNLKITVNSLQEYQNELIHL